MADVVYAYKEERIYIVLLPSASCIKLAYLDVLQYRCTFLTISKVSQLVYCIFYTHPKGLTLT